ncbi:hypothetical protein ACSQ67_025256 [Phaseolus vulgaris]
MAEGRWCHTNHIPTMEEYMEHKVSRKCAIEELQKLVENAWKDINEACLAPTQVQHRRVKVANVDEEVAVGAKFASEHVLHRLRLHHREGRRRLDRHVHSAARWSAPPSDLPAYSMSFLESSPPASSEQLRF